ncbi:MAG TPA: ABC transporter permease [Terriglobales bacterium]|nr:ABC transporter permease [Terriglobales bacterium]
MIAAASSRSRPIRVADGLHDVLVMTRRNLIHIAREPMQLSDVTIQPVLFTMLFVYVFGSGIPVPGGTYAAFAIAGLLLLNLTTSSMGTAIGLTSDLSTGIIDRFRTLPMWSPAVLIGRSLTDLLTAVLCTLIVAGAGLVVGWRPALGPGHALAGFGVALLFAYALSWLAGCVGLWARGVETAQSFGFLLLFPLSFISNALVPTRGMPDWLRTIADWNPVSAVTAACRVLWGNPNPSAASPAWSMQHPIWTAVAWSIAILAVCLPLASVLYRRRTTD